MTFETRGALRCFVLRCLFALGLLWSGVAIAARSSSAATPADFDVVAVTGGRFSGPPSVFVHIDASGHGSYAVFRPDSFTTGPIDSVSFTLTAGQRDSLWLVVSGAGFFSLATSYGDTSLADGSFASLRILANATTRTVVTNNVAMAAFDGIMARLNVLTPGARDLLYDTAGPDAFTPQDGCGDTISVPVARRAADLIMPAPAGLAPRAATLRDLAEPQRLRAEKQVAAERFDTAHPA